MLDPTVIDMDRVHDQQYDGDAEAQAHVEQACRRRSRRGAIGRTIPSRGAAWRT